jgi:hypothetical protein
MKPVPLPWILALVLSVAVGAAGTLRADILETREGAHLTGRVTKITGGKVYLETDYAGVITVDQIHVVRLETDAPLSVRLINGTRVDGRLSSRDDRIEVAAVAGPVSASVTEIAACWVPGAPEPPGLRPRHHWSYEAAVDVTGKNGNHNQLGTAYALVATLTRLKDTLVLSTSYNRQTSDGVKSADQLKAGADYSSNFADKNSWYVRDAGGFDRLKDLRLYNLAATGEGYDFIKKVGQTLTGRLGLAYRYEDYSQNAAQDVNSLGLDLGLNYTRQIARSLLTTRLAIVPTLEHFDNLTISHETDFDIPITKSAWKLRLGVANDYNSRPPPRIEKLDTTYFGRLMLSWK